MNTLRRPRTRPRVRSVNFRTFAWLLVREAYLRIRFRTDQPKIGEFGYRQVMDTRTDNLRNQAERWIDLYPERRFFP